MSVGGLFALLLLIALAVSMALLKPQVPGRIMFAGFAAGVFLLPMFETHYSQLSVFSFILMLVGLLHELAAWLTEGRPRPPWLEWLLDPVGQRGRRLRRATSPLPCSRRLCGTRRRLNTHPGRRRRPSPQDSGVGCAIGRPQRGPARAGQARADPRSPALSLRASRGAPSPRLRPSSSDRRAARPRAQPGSRW